MGNVNGDSTDDIRFPNDTQIQTTGVTEQEIFDWGQTWMIDPVASLFTYEPGDSAATYGDVSFTPMFFDLATMFPNPTVRDAAIATCGGSSDAQRECLFDIASTGNAAIGANTANSQQEFESERSILQNRAPVFTNNGTTIQVEAGGSLSTTVMIDATDADGDSLEYSLQSPAPAGVSINNATGELGWAAVPASLNLTIPLVVIVSDGTASATLSVQIEFCACQNGGTCEWDQESEEAVLQVPCMCIAGWVGEMCDMDDDGCANDPCYTTVACSDVTAPGTGFECGPCPAGLDGDGSSCVERDECIDQPCAQVCTNMPGSFHCDCNAGYSLAADLRACSDVDECTLGTDDCAADATCSNIAGSFGCTCNTGYYGSGQVCFDVNECEASPCGANELCSNTVGSYTCTCMAGYEYDPTASACLDVDACAEYPLCDQVCVDGAASYSCACNAGYQLDGATACIPDTECTTQQIALTCNTTGDATPTCAVISSYPTCACPQGYTLNSHAECVDVDECQGNHACNQATSTCNNSVGSYSCTCNAGYVVEGDGITCQDVDECSGSHTCGHTCTNTAGSYTCSCSSGYLLQADGSCQDIDECATQNGGCDVNHGVCGNTAGGRTCTCQAGFTGDGILCIDKNECALDLGGCTQGCNNVQGSFTCFCGNGYTLDSDNVTCIDYDECAKSGDNRCMTGQCSNTAGTYMCSCGAGFTLNSDGFSCDPDTLCAAGHGCAHGCSKQGGVDMCYCPSGYVVNGQRCDDVDECANTTDHSCDAANHVTCVNNNGSYTCECSDKVNYIQLSQYSCEDRDECSEGLCPANSACENKSPGYTCTCSPGYVLAGSSCVDVDECSAGSHTCNMTLGTCTNTDGGYTCACIDHYTGDGRQCSDVDECQQPGAGGCDVTRGWGSCHNTPGSYNCSCFPGYLLDSAGKLCNDVNECSPTNPAHDCQQLCVNRDGTYSCSCNPGYSLLPDQKNCTVLEECPSQHTCGDLCAMVAGQEVCSCSSSFFTLGADNQTCVDVDECQNNPCVGNVTCHNTVGGFTCTCAADFTLRPDGLTCLDRDGAWGVWGAWGACSATCDGGQEMRTRSCDSPAPLANGVACAGPSSESQACALDLCPLVGADLSHGFIISFVGLTPQEVTNVMSDLKKSVANATNHYCSANFADCCPGYGTRQTSGVLTFTTGPEIEIGHNYPRANAENVDTTDVLFVIKADNQNALCMDGDEASSAFSAGRKKRATVVILANQIAIPPAVLTMILQMTSSTTQLMTVLQTFYPNATITIIAVGPANPPPEAEEKKGLSPAMIALIVIACLIVLVALIVFVVVVVSKKTKDNKVNGRGYDQAPS